MRVRIEGQTLRPSGGNGALGDIWVGLTEGGRGIAEREGEDGRAACLFFSSPCAKFINLPYPGEILSLIKTNKVTIKGTSMYSSI